MEALSPATRAPGAPLPVLVLTGFLGAGKSSLLNHLLGGAPGLRIAAVVNDFGAIDVDASAVAGRVDSVISLANGCMCCEVDASEISGALTSLADPEHGLDLAVIEASGLAEPHVLARMVHDAPRESVAYAGMVQVVDAENLVDSLAAHPRLGAHLADADLVVVNKCDLVGREGFEALREVVRTHAPRVAVVPAVRGDVPVGLLLGLEPEDVGDHDGCHGQKHGGSCEHCHEHAHLHDDYTAVTVVPAGPLHPRRALAALSSPPAGAYRAKGALTLGTAGGPRRYDVALVGRRLELRAESDTHPVDGAEGLVVIGVDLPADAAGFLDGAVLSEGEIPDDAALLGLHPFLVAEHDASDVEEWIYDEYRSTPLTGNAQMLADPEDPDTGDPAFTP